MKLALSHLEGKGFDQRGLFALIQAQLTGALVDQQEAVKSIFTVAGFSFAGSGQNAAIGFVNLKHWDERQRPDLSVGAVAGKAMGYFSTIKEAFVFAFPPPAVVELGTAIFCPIHLLSSALCYAVHDASSNKDKL